MKRLVPLLILVIALIFGLHRYASRPPAPVPVQSAATTGPRALTGGEDSAFLPLVCAGATGTGGGYAHQCTSLPGYPSQDYGGAGLGLGITLTSVAYGHFTADGQAYVSYKGSFEPHATNWGGGILFNPDGKGGWTLAAWHPGGQLDHCLALDGTGRARFICLSDYTGQGEEDSVIATFAPPGQPQAVLKASDLRGTLDPEANCAKRGDGQAVLLAIKSLARAGDGFTAGISYVPAGTAQSACAAKGFATTPVSSGTLTLTPGDNGFTISPSLNFAPAE